MPLRSLKRHRPIITTMSSGKKTCLGCGNKEAWAVHNKKEKLTGVVYQECNKCFDNTIPSNPDVYFKEPYWDYNLHDMDDPSYDPRRGTYITSKQHKAYVLKKLNLREAGDREGGRRIFDRYSALQWNR